MPQLKIALEAAHSGETYHISGYEAGCRSAALVEMILKRASASPSMNASRLVRSSLARIPPIALDSLKLRTELGLARYCFAGAR